MTVIVVNSIVKTLFQGMIDATKLHNSYENEVCSETRVL
nr:MAG TPA: hypothetical protein [Caudoviricetes sp.]